MIASLIWGPLLGLLGLTACTKQSVADAAAAPIVQPFQANGRSWLALGDSYTIGESVGTVDRYPAQTAALLKSAGMPIAEPQYIARTGWTTTNLQEAIGAASLKPKYDIVSLLIGVNDQYRGLDTGGYRLRFTQLLQTAISSAGNDLKHVFVLSIPDYGVTPFGGGSARISQEIDAFNSINKEVSLTYKVNYIDITPISREAHSDQSLTADDKLHPSAKQYQRWAGLLAIGIKQVFQ
jgi:lysophospholipase L1-like esterase